MPTIQERENLMVDLVPKRTGFTPRHIETLATRKKPHTTINIECNHFLRTSTENATHGIPLLSYQMWREAGKHQPPFPDQPDEQYNSNVWRNFRKSYGFHVNSKGQTVNEMIANMYPLNVPAPSKVGDYTFEKFLREIPLIKDDKLRKMAIERTKRDVAECKRLRLRSDDRSPPIDPDGIVLPPQNYKKYVKHFIQPTSPRVTQSQPVTTENTRVDIFGQMVPKPKAKPHMWKLTSKLNNPEHEKIREEISLRKSMMKPSPAQHGDPDSKVTA